MIKLSIIVPIYGVEQYLQKCVDSLLSQDIPSSDYEIILVDDGSTDECPQICDDYAAAHRNIRVVHRENGGLSVARNSGIMVAQGEYVMFVDSDDYIEPNVLRELLEQVERDNLDVLRFDFRNVNEQYEVFYPNKAPKRDVDLRESVVDGETFLNERLGPGCYVSHFIIKRDLIVTGRKSKVGRQDCLFKEGIYFEDVDWTPRMLMRAKRVASTNKVVYNYLWREGSITLPDNPEKKKKVLEDRISLLRGFKEQQELVKDKSWYVWMTSNTTKGVLTAISKLPLPERKKYIQELERMEIFPLSIKREKMVSHRIKTIIANISPSLYCILMNAIDR